MIFSCLSAMIKVVFFVFFFVHFYAYRIISLVLYADFLNQRIYLYLSSLITVNFSTCLFVFFSSPQLANLLLQLKDTASALKLINGLLG